MFQTSNFYFLLRKIRFVPCPDIMFSQTLMYYGQKNPHFDSDIRQWSHPLMIPLHWLWAKLNSRTCGQFECDVTWFCFYFDFVRSHAWCGCCSIVYLRFQAVKKWNRLIAKWVLKMWIIINKRHFVIFLRNCKHKSIKPQKRR